MQIKIRVNDFLYTLFPEVSTNNEIELIAALKSYYAYGPYVPKINLMNGWVNIEIDTPSILSQEADYRKVVALCEKRNYKEAKPILEKLIQVNPSNSEYHRIKGQILSDEGDQEEAINSLIDALRWDSTNSWALVMMGNIFARSKNDIETAMKYYDQALLVKPDDHITLNNIGANLMQQEKLNEAKKYFWAAIKNNENYPNTHFALGMIAEIEGDLNSAFYSLLKAIKTNKQKDVLYQNSVKLTFEVAKKISETDIGKKLYRKYRKELELAGGIAIDIVVDEEIPTAAKIEFAENYNRTKHIIMFKPEYPAVGHLIMHELVHLDFVIKAREKGLNKLFVATQDQKKQFITGLEDTIKKFNKMGIAEQAIANYCSSLFDGINRQIFNGPIDLFIENHLYEEYPVLRAYQFLSLYTLVQEGLKAVTDKKIVELSPKDIIAKSKIYNIVGALQFRDLYGFDFISDYKASAIELKQAQEFYNEFLEYKEDKSPAEEYELVLHWAEDLKLEKNFELINENEYRNKRTDLDQLLTSIENDPFDLETKDPLKEREMDKFQQSQAEIGLNMAIVMFMIDAFRYFKDMPKEDIKKIAFEIAMQGTQGYQPDRKDYRVSAIPGKLFSGYHILAYYYISWMLAIPEMVSQLQLPYDEEYKLAIKMEQT